MESTAPEHPPGLLIIDVQKAIDHPSWGRRNNVDAERRMSELLAHWRQRGWPILHVRHSSREPGSTYRPDQSGFEFKAEVAPIAGEIVVTKHTNNAFLDTELDARLKARSIGTLVVCGVITNNSVEATVRMAGNLGYLTYVVSDATATFDRVDLEGTLRSAEDMHAIALANMHGEYARAVTTAEVLSGLEIRRRTRATHWRKFANASIGSITASSRCSPIERASSVKPRDSNPVQQPSGCRIVSNRSYRTCGISLST